MEICEVTPEEYDRLTGDDIPIFCRSRFLELNRNKVEQVHYLIGREKKNRMALAIGEKEGRWQAPFSAPFGKIIFLRRETRIHYIWEFVRELGEYIKERGGNNVSIYLPAGIYDFRDNARVLNALLGNGYGIAFVDVNYSFDLSVPQAMEHNGRKNLRIALNSGLEFIPCRESWEKELAYDIIKINREYRGFPLRMTKEQVMETLGIVAHDCFLVRKGDRAVASAIVYRLTKKVAQVIYWGDIPSVGEYKPINFLSSKLVEFYKELGFEILDIGISTERGWANYGLCDFKESLGCIPSEKFMLYKDMA